MIFTLRPKLGCPYHGLKSETSELCERYNANVTTFLLFMSGDDIPGLLP